MPDTIIGIAVLDRSTKPHTLLFLCQHADGHQSVHHIPVRPESEPRANTREWEYRIDGGVLHCKPSVWVQLKPPDAFHNEAAWSVRFVEYFYSKGSLFNAVNPDHTAPKP
jgi:hypothetical protein